MDEATLEIIRSSAGLLARHAMTGLGTWLVAHQLVDPGQRASLEQIGAGIILGGAGIAWSWWQKRGHVLVLSTLAKLTGRSIADTKGAVR